MRMSDRSSDVCSSVSAYGDDSVALGANSIADADNSVALGANSYADRANTVSVGSAGNERQITNVAAGTEDTDAVNLAQLQEVAKTADNTDHFFKASDDPDNPGVGAYVEGINATAAGENANAIGDGTSAYGSGAYRSEEHTSDLQSLMRIAYAVFCLTKKIQPRHIQST